MIRLTAQSARLAAIRPSTMMAARPSINTIRTYATEQPDPKQKANSIIEAMPGNSAVSKTGILATGAAAGVYAISNGLYVVNGESLMLLAFSGVFYIMSKTAAPAYGAWAKGHVDAVKNILSGARQGHVESVQERIESVNQLKDVVQTTKDLFSVSKETAELEAKVFEKKQQVNYAAEAKSVLDSYVRYEGQVRQMEQEELANNVMNKVNKEIQSSKFKQQVLEQAVADVEKLFAKKA